MTNARQARSAREKAAEMRAEAARKESRRLAILVISLVTAAIVVIVGAGAVILIARQNKIDTVAKAAAPPANLVDSGIQIGQANAKVKIEIYEDFQCPFCMNFEKESRAQIKAWVADGTAKVIYHPVAILDRGSSTNYSTRSLNAAAVVINTDPTKFTTFHDLLFDNQPAEGGAGLPDSSLIDFAVKAGLTSDQVSAPITSLKYQGWSVTVTEAFSKKGFTGTPTVVVNGKQLGDDHSAAKLKAAVDAAAKG
jgi:protein-disulfide isomerase